jgi:hypothetical protein
VDGAISVLGKPLVVGDHANRGTDGVQFIQQFHDRFAIAGIEITSRFVGEKNRRLGR